MKNIKILISVTLVLISLHLFAADEMGHGGSYDGHDMAQSSSINLGDVPLPVTLSSFSVSQLADNPALLNWTTQSETNNLGWNLYRSNTYHFDNSLVLNSDLIDGSGNSSTTSEYQYQDPYSIIGGESYWYWLESISYSGASELFGPSILTVPYGSGSAVPEVPEDFGLHQNFPNPFNPSTAISFKLAENSNCDLAIYDSKGRKIKDLFSGNIVADQIFNFIWNGTDNDNNSMPSGIYLYKLKTDKSEQIRKAILVK